MKTYEIETLGRVSQVRAQSAKDAIINFTGLSVAFFKHMGFTIKEIK